MPADPFNVSRNPPPKLSWNKNSRKCRAAFSLIECVLALGIVSFAFISLVGMIPVGLNTFRDAMDATVGSQIAQGVLTEVRQAKFSELAKFNKNADTDPANPSPDYFFDDEGTASATATAENHIYDAAVRIQYTSRMPVGVAPSTLECDPAVANVAVVRVVVRRVTAPKQSREFIGFIANNGL